MAREKTRALLLITHDLSVAQRISDRVAVTYEAFRLGHMLETLWV